MYKIPLFDLNFDEAEERAVLDVIRSKWISTGPKTAEFEEKFAEMLNVKHAVALANCTVALHLALKLVDVKENDEVICPSLTFVATINAIRYMNAVPVFADVSSLEDLTMSPADIESKITPKTKAIVVMHYGGFACDMVAIMALAKKHNLKVIEDACHAPLSEYKGQKLGTIGDVGCFSFFSNKNISTGEGGMLVTNSEEYYKRTKLLRSHGMTSMSYERAKGHSTEYDVVELGFNYRMDDIRSAIGLVQLQKIEDDLKEREIIRRAYIKELSGIESIIIPFRENREFSSNYVFPIVLKDSDYIKRNKIRELLAEEGIQTSVHYPAVHKFSIYQDFYTELPKTDYAADNMITLPMYSKLTVDDVKFIATVIKGICK
ncbi:DegT/DnrJ/EryC1/StrS family aminotransferase [Pedobacter gandavensis]|uniref:DegT/DnrJ/EryC1/StrS family aminotransferase n=1 Tax=Pedobacter gandavensis TaxID=2679963 RepID=UPI0029305DF5|nr:DegT/DnrJ/EryC1/StrS family aminotransferase [Pedobacter gandavensis]